MRKKHTETPARPKLPVGTFARRQLVDRLTQAVALAREAGVARLGSLRDMLEDALARVAALELTTPPESEEGAAQPAPPPAQVTADTEGAAEAGVAEPACDATPALVASHLPGTLLATSHGEPVDAFLLIPFGTVTVERPVAGGSFRFSRADAEALCAWFARLGRKLAIDYEHQSFDRLNTRADGLRPAAGWIGGLEVRDDGLWAVDVVWTERARALLRSGEYRYFSPVVYWADEERSAIAALGPVALTNDPAMHGVRPLAARRSEGLAGAAADAPATPEDAAVLRRALAASEAEVARLRRDLAEHAAEAFVERGLRLGKIVAATRGDWRADYLRDPQAAEARLGRAPVLLPPGRLTTPEEGGGALAGDIAPRPWTTEPDDLAAYGRAAAAGRVVAPHA